jgi:hypothetical protein
MFQLVLCNHTQRIELEQCNNLQLTISNKQSEGYLWLTGKSTLVPTVNTPRNESVTLEKTVSFHIRGYATYHIGLREMADYILET